MLCFMKSVFVVVSRFFEDAPFSVDRVFLYEIDAKAYVEKEKDRFSDWSEFQIYYTERRVYEEF